MNRITSNASVINGCRRPATGSEKASFWQRRVRRNAAIACSSLLLALSTVGNTFAQSIDVGTSTDFVNAVQTLNSDPNTAYTLNLTSGFTMGSQSNDFASNSTVTLSGNLNTIDGGGLYQPLIIDSGTLVLQSLTTTNTGSPIMINGGTLVDTDNSLQGAVTNNGAVQFSQITAASYIGNMSGTGTVDVNGVGPVTFSGLNSYTGGTTVDLGAALIGTTDSLQGGFTNNGSVQFSQLVAGTYAGSMSGTGSVEITGGPVTFSGINSYTGGTTVDAASTLIGTTDSLQGGITNNGAVQFSQLVAGTYAGSMSGTGSVEITGGPVTFSGINSYTGGTTVDAASTLIGTTDSLQGSFTNNGAVQFSQLVAGTYAGSMTGTGSVEITGGPVTFSGINSYTGGTTVDAASTLIGTTDSLQGGITNNGAVQFSQLVAGTYAGSMTGTGSVEITGGPVTFSGINSYTGGTAVDAASTLIGTTDSLQGGITNNGAVQFSQLVAGTYAGSMTGTGSVEITGGPVTFSGINSYTGGTTVDVASTLIGTTDSLQGGITNNGAVQFSQLVAGTYAGSMTGTGSVEITGGPVTFSGINSYTGGTTVDAASTLIGTTDSIQGGITNNGAVQFSQLVAGTYAGSMTGTGSVEITGGPVTFSGINSYTGGTTVDAASTLIGTTDSLQGGITNNGAVQFSQLVAGTYAGSMTGTGSLEITGGPVTFSGINSYTGGTTVDVASTLIGTTDSLQGGITNNGAVQFSQLVAGTYAGSMTGTGSVEITGGPVTFSGINSYTGGTTVDAASTLIGTTDSLQGGITNNGAVQFSQLVAGTYAGSMTGTGSVEITGGPVTFSGINSYTGGTTVDAASTLIGTTDSLQGGITNNGAVQFSQLLAGTYAGSMTGTGSVEITGGPVTFSGINSYTGGTTVDAASTLIGNVNSIQGSVINNGTVNFTQDTTSTVFTPGITIPGQPTSGLIYLSTYAGDISGTGSVKIGAGTAMSFTGTNTYSGGTTVDNGAWLLGSSSTLQGNLTNNGGVQFNQAAGGTFAGNIIGTGGVEVSGVGSLTLTGTNTYSGGTWIDNSSTLIGATTSVQGTIVNSGSVIFDQAIAGTYAGSMSGTGSVEISGVGPVTFTGTNSYSGGTTIDNGSTLIGTTQSLSGAFNNSGLLTFNQATSGTFSGNISGTGGVEIGGVGPITFSAANLYTGTTNINNGSTLNVVGSIVGDTNVNSGGVLAGSGSVGNVTVNSGGTIAPGTVGAPLTINGNFNQMTGSKYTVEVGPSASDKIITTGTATIGTGSTLHIVADPGSYVIGKKYDILSATGGLTGQYSTVVTTQSSNVIFTEQYTANDLQLTVNSAFLNSAHTANQRAIATVLDQQSGAATGDFATAITQLTSIGGGQFSSALNQLSGEIHASLGTVQQQTTTAQMQLLSNRLAYLSRTVIPAVTSASSNRSIRLVSAQGGDAISPDASSTGTVVEPPAWNSWAQGYGLGGNIGGDGNAGGTNYRLGGTLFGVERWLGESTMIGALGGYAATSVKDRQDGSNANINSYQVGLYELQRFDSIYLSNIDAYTNSAYNVSRPINFGNINETASGSSSGNQWSHYTELGNTISFDDIHLQTFTGFQYMYLTQAGYSESGAGALDLTTGSLNVSSSRSSLGARLSTETNWRGILITPTLSARYMREFGEGTHLITSSLAGAPTATFVSSGNSTGRNFGLFSLGATAYVTENMSVYGSIDTQAASNYFAVVGSGGMQFSW